MEIISKSIISLALLGMLSTLGATSNVNNSKALIKETNTIVQTSENVDLLYSLLKYNKQQTSETEMLHIYTQTKESFVWIKEQSANRNPIIIFLYKSMFEKYAKNFVKELQNQNKNQEKFAPLGVYAKNLLISDLFLYQYSTHIEITDYLEQEIQASFQFLSGFINEDKYLSILKDLNMVAFETFKQYTQKEVDYTKNVFYNQYLKSLELLYQIYAYSTINISKEDLKKILEEKEQKNVVKK